jgi:LysR family transcriptional activator of nhaA
VQWLNYHHLLYFWKTAKSGSFAAAARDLQLSPSALSTQVKELERAIGQRLFVRSGRRLALTEAGEVACRFADDIFRLGEEMQVVLRDAPRGRKMKLGVGVVDDFPPLVVERLLRPAFASVPGLRLSVRRSRLHPLLHALGTHQIDLVLATESAATTVRGKAREAFLGESGTTLFAGGRLADLRNGFPRSLDGAPLLYGEAGGMRDELDAWFREQSVRPAVVAECDDQATLRAFAARGSGFFPGATVVEEEIVRTVGVSVIGRVPDVRLRFYAVTMERRQPHPGVVAVLAAPPVDASSLGLST